jgi:hypothetical protein
MNPSSTTIFKSESKALVGDVGVDVESGGVKAPSLSK